jgi:hypothetical protein
VIDGRSHPIEDRALVGVEDSPDVRARWLGTPFQEQLDQIPTA